MKVDLEELIRVKKYLQKINRANLEDIKWRKNGVVLEFEKEVLEEFQSCGLSNTDFPPYHGLFPRGLGVRVSTITISKKTVIKDLLIDSIHESRKSDNT